MKLLLITLLMVPMVAVAACEAELSYFATSVDLFTKVKKIHDINKKLFGKESMNFLGLPYIVSKESKGDPIYICAKDGNTELK
jgi:hypothetical protein